MVSDLFVFNLAGHRIGLPLDSVIRVFQAVEISPLPQAPPSVLGVVNVRGRLLPVLDIRARFGLAAQELQVSNQMVMIQSQKRQLLILIDSSVGVVACNLQDQIAAEELDPRMVWMDAVIRSIDGVVYVHNVERFLSLEEESILSQVLTERQCS
ncbi:chemotaxis protein CheW [bacterium]|nr:chemotaxis protein CheW [bacterium]